MNHVISYDSFNLTSGEIVNDLLLGERPYMAFMYAVATVLSGYLGVITRKKFWFLFSICFIAFIIYISARIALVSIIFVALMGVIYLKKSSLISVGIIMLVISIIVGVLTLNENVRQRFLISNINENSHLKEKLIFEPRYHIWECTSHLNQNATSILVGKGFKNTTKELVECYKNRTEFYTEDQKNWFIQSEFNTHNQYLGLYWSSGLISLLAFISFLLFTCMEHRKNYFAISLLMVLMFFLLTENMLHRQLGAMLISLVYVFVNFISTPRSELKDID
ncbi:MAG: O-antigen ligase family protein [Weeksellaceae bacterium]